jgi:aminoglycoside 2'-N-acetyltransferase I
VKATNRDASNGLVLRVGRQADFGQEELECARQLLELAFDGTISDADWEQGLGGVHVLAWQEDLLVGHASLIPGRLLYCGKALGTGYVDAVAVRPDCQRRGIGGSMMDVLEEIIVSNFELGVLAASDAGAAFYQQRSWLKWRGPVPDLTPLVGRRPVAREAGVFVFPGTRALDSERSEG